MFCADLPIGKDLPGIGGDSKDSKSDDTLPEIEDDDDDDDDDEEAGADNAGKISIKYSINSQVFR